MIERVEINQPDPGARNNNKIEPGENDVRSKQVVPEREKGVPDKKDSTRVQAAQAPRRESNRAFFALEDDGRVVVRIVDEEGQIVKQIPPEEYIKTAKALKENVNNLFHREV